MPARSGENGTALADLPPDARKAIGDALKREGVQAPEEITEDAKRWRLTFRGENGKSGTLTLPIPARMTAYAADIHDKENIRARSPLLYKELRFEGVARGTESSGRVLLRLLVIRWSSKLPAHQVIAGDLSASARRVCQKRVARFAAGDLKTLMGKLPALVATTPKPVSPGIALAALRNGRLYHNYVSEEPAESSDTDIQCRYSDDNGATWSNPVRVNDDTGTNSQFNPKIQIDSTTGNIAVAWYGTLSHFDLVVAPLTVR
ncbi:hypothetical protein BH18VER2_BH18VER2_07650 [soil metagenome]